MTQERTSQNPAPRVLAYERHDPSDTSLDWLREQGVEVCQGRAVTDPGFRRYDNDTIIEDASGFDAVIGASTAHFPKEVLEALPRLRCISKYGIGVDSIDLTVATERGILVSNTLDPMSVMAVAEHAIAMMLALKKRLMHWTPGYLRQGGWRDSQHASMVTGNTIGIVGLGRIGRAVAQRLEGWGVRILAFDPYVRAQDAPAVELVALDELLEVSDVVTLHCDATADNHHLLGAAALHRMKAGALLVNTGRGSLVDTQALTERLRTGALGGAALDVFEQEPPDPHLELLTLPNLVVTPHVASWTKEIFLERRMQGARNLLAMLIGETCPAIVNPAALNVASQSTQHPTDNVKNIHEERH